jgi:hypothetical protein
VDASFDGTVAPAKASFELLFDGVVVTPLACANTAWTYTAPVAGDGGSGMDGGGQSVAIHNLGNVPIYYTARAGWFLGQHYAPSVNTHSPPEATGVVAPGASAELSSGFPSGVIGVFALFGASAPFPGLDGGSADEGQTPWPLGSVPNPADASVMYMAETNVYGNCSSSPFQAW